LIDLEVLHLSLSILQGFTRIHKTAFREAVFHDCPKTTLTVSRYQQVQYIGIIIILNDKRR
jgi:hypothetical protein